MFEVISYDTDTETVNYEPSMTPSLYAAPELFHILWSLNVRTDKYITHPTSFQSILTLPSHQLITNDNAALIYHHTQYCNYNV
jgi:hypothetical protein